jgi:maleate cis-trans isomerase
MAERACQPTVRPRHSSGFFFRGNRFLSAGAIQALEEELGCPVLSANQALFWNLLGFSGRTHEVAGYGRLFDHALPGWAMPSMGGLARVYS